MGLILGTGFSGTQNVNGTHSTPSTLPIDLPVGHAAPLQYSSFDIEFSLSVTWDGVGANPSPVPVHVSYNVSGYGVAGDGTPPTSSVNCSCSTPWASQTKAGISQQSCQLIDTHTVYVTLDGSGYGTWTGEFKGEGKGISSPINVVWAGCYGNVSASL